MLKRQQRDAVQPAGGSAGRFPREADGCFDVVEQHEIDAWRVKLSAEHGYGTKKFEVVDDPFQPA